jgi:hypothetical protein
VSGSDPPAVKICQWSQSIERKHYFCSVVRRRRTPPRRVIFKRRRREFKNLPRREIGNFIAINSKFIKRLFETLFQIENNCVTG